jgi:hypothetical protein
MRFVLPPFWLSGLISLFADTVVQKWCCVSHPYQYSGAICTDLSKADNSVSKFWYDLAGHV